MKRGALTIACLMLLSLQTLGAPTVEELIAQSRSSSAAVREQAAAALGEVAGPTDAAIAALIELLEDVEFGSGSSDLGNPINLIARWSLERHGKAAIPQLIARLTHSRPEARAAAAETLGALRDGRATSPLTALLDDADESVHQTAVRALGAIGDPAAFDALHTLITDEAIRAAPMDVMRAMANCNPRQGRTSLIQLAKHDDREIREAAVSVMVERRDVETIDALLAAIDDSYIHVQCTAAQALEWIVPVRGPETAVTAFAKKDAYHDVRVIALHALAVANEPRTAELAIEGLSDPSDEVKEAALWYLQHHPDVRALSPLLETLRTAKYNGVRMEACEALGALGDRRAVPGLIAALADPTPLGRIYAARALAELGDRSAREPLIRLKNEDDDVGVREAAALAVERLQAIAAEMSPR
jgi:HEAT repeat protein